MKIQISKTSLTKMTGETLVVFVANKKVTSKKETKSTKVFSCSCKSLKDFVAKEDVITGIKNETTFFRNANLEGFKHLLVVGLGNSKSVSLEVLRQVSAIAGKSAASNKSKSFTVCMDSLASYCKKSDSLARSVGEGLLLAFSKFDEFKKKKVTDDLDVTFATNTASKNSGFKAGLSQAEVLAECTNFARRLGDLPGNKLTPTILANETIKAAKGTKLKVTAWDKAQIKKAKMGALLGVSAGSLEDPRFIVMEYKGAAASKKPVCFVGKGLTFDAGGISLKPAPGMEEMKYDMCGGSAVIGAMLAIAKLKLKVNAIAYVPASENLPGVRANKPGDILTARNGTTIEVNNTDAEGRLILADALCWASEKKPAAIIDAATLTGAIIIALGNHYTGLFTRDAKLLKKVQDAADRSGEKVWPMPICDGHVKDLKGTYADLSNITAGRGAGSSTAAAFLEQFVDDDIPWIHCDIAGTAWNTANRLSYSPKKGATGVMVRTFFELAKSF